MATTATSCVPILVTATESGPSPIVRSPILVNVDRVDEYQLARLYAADGQIADRQRGNAGGVAAGIECGHLLWLSRVANVHEPETAPDRIRVDQGTCHRESPTQSQRSSRRER